MPNQDILTNGSVADDPSGRLPEHRLGGWGSGRLHRGAGKCSAVTRDRKGGVRRAFWLNRSLASAILLGGSFVFGGCGGGGGTGEEQRAATIPEIRLPEPQPPQEPPPPPVAECIALHDGTCASTEDFDARAQELAGDYAAHVQFQNQWGLAAIGADRAYAHAELLKGEDAAPGAGVTIGFIDTGIDQGHPMVAGAIVSEVFLDGAADETGHESSHGTAVASIAAGIRGLPLSFVPHGVAWGANIAMFAIPLGVGDGTYNPISLEDLAADDAGSAQQFNQVLTWRDGQRRVDVLNLSFGYQGLIDDYGEADLRASLPETIAALAQDGAGEKAILVWAAGNSNANTCGTSIPNCETGALNADSPSVLAGLAARIPELRGHTVAVVALTPVDEVALKPSDETIATFSNRCGLAADFCLAAPGNDVTYAYFGPDTRYLRTRPGHPGGRWDVLRRADRERRIRDHEAALPGSALERGPGDAPVGDRRQYRRFLGQHRLRSGQARPRSRNASRRCPRSPGRPEHERGWARPSHHAPEFGCPVWQRALPIGLGPRNSWPWTIWARRSGTGSGTSSHRRRA